MALNLSYPAILQHFGDRAMSCGTESRAFLAWFLENYYRLEEIELDDSLCDGHADKGIDGLYLNEQLRQIDIFQVTLFNSNDKTQGDAKLKQFVGAISQFNTSANATSIIASANDELKAIAKRLNLIERIDEGYEVRGVYITNGNADAAAKTYHATQPNLILYDGTRLQNEFITINKTDPIASPKTFDVVGIPLLEYSIGANLKMVVAPILAAELVTMSGISNGELFSWNVRQFLGKKTAVNKSVAESIRTPMEHKYFPAFHNGVTILCKKLDVTTDSVTISGYAVVNGCQSINSLFDNRSSITSELRILTKFVEIEPDSELAKKITDHTNNQNGITARDLQSNSPIQTRLQSEISRRFPEYHYRIKRGEHPEWDKEAVIENESLARIVLAFDLNKMEAWSQNYKLFDDLHGEIFGRPEVNADRVIFLVEAYNSITSKLCLLTDKLFAHYTLTRWLLIYLVKRALVADERGKQLCDNPAAFMAEPAGRTRLKECIGHVAQNIVRVLDSTVMRRKSQMLYFDYKNDLKNREFIEQLASEVIPAYQIIVDNKYTESFSDKWKSSANGYLAIK